MKKLFILFSTILLMISLGGCRMSIDRKAIAEKALQKQYGEEFVAYHTWDHGGDSFRASMYPKDDESIKFEVHVFNEGGIITDYYAEKIVGKEIIEVIKPYIDEIAEESAYFATIPIQDLGYTSKEEVSIEDFYTKGKNDEPKWPYIDICINFDTIKQNTTYEHEYEILLNLFNDEDLKVIGGKKLILYYISDETFNEYKDYFDSIVYIDGRIKFFPEIKNKILIKIEDGIVSITLDEYIQKRKELSYE